jgi:hypothetical protein
MKFNSALIIWAFMAVFIVAAGCTSFGGSAPSPTVVPTSQGPTPASTGQPVSTKATPYVLPVLTGAQKAQAESLAKANNTVKQDVLSKPQFTVKDIYADYPAAGSNDIIARVTFEGRDAAHSDSNQWMAEQYLVFVDLTTNQVTLITHVGPKQLPAANPT